MTKFDVSNDLDVKITLVITFFLFQKISTNPIEFLYPMSGFPHTINHLPFFLGDIHTKRNVRGVYAPALKSKGVDFC